MGFGILFGEPFDPFLVDAADLHDTVKVGQAGNDGYQTACTHAAEMAVSFDEDGVRTVPACGNSGTNAAWTATYHNNVTLTDHINGFIWFGNLSYYVCHFLSSFFALLESTHRPVTVYQGN